MPSHRLRGSDRCGRGGRPAPAQRLGCGRGGGPCGWSPPAPRARARRETWSHPMKRFMLLVIALWTAGAVFGGLARPLARELTREDEGMWTFDNPPRTLLKEKHGFDSPPRA